MRNTALKRIIAIVLALLLLATSIPMSAIAEESDEYTVEQLQNQIQFRLLTYTSNIKCVDNIKMGNKTLLSYYCNNLVYSSNNLSTGHQEGSSTIDMYMKCPKVVVGVYDGINLPTFPVSAYIYLTSEHRILGIVLHDEDALYQLTAPTERDSCTNVWRGVNRNLDWVTPEEISTDFFLTSKRSDYKYRAFYTRGNYNGYEISASNTLTPRLDYLVNEFSNTDKGYICSVSNDTGFHFVTTSYSDSNPYMIETPTYCNLGEGAAQYFIDYSPITNLVDEIKIDFNNVMKTASHYDESAVKAYYQKILDVLNYNISSKFSDVNDDTAVDMVEQVSAEIKDMVSQYHKAYNDLGELYVDITEAKNNVDENYATATLAMPNTKIKFNGVVLNDVSFAGSTYNFGKNLAYCSPNVETSSYQFINNVNSWVTIPKTVVLVFDGVHESSFPVKIGFGKYTSASSYTGSKLSSIMVGDEQTGIFGSNSRVFTGGNNYWLCCNAVASIKVNDWFSSASNINCYCPNGNVNTGVGIELCEQYGGFFNKVTLNNGNYLQSPEVDPMKGKPLTLFYRYLYEGNDNAAHCAATTTRQYVVNVKPIVDKLEVMKADYADSIGKNGVEAYAPESVNNYYLAVNKLINFNIDTYFAGCSDVNAKAKVEYCQNEIDKIIADYDEAYKGLSKQYKITFVNYDKEVVAEQYYNENEMPVAPENTAIKKISNTSRYHYSYSWPTITKATATKTYTERRSSDLCTLDNGTVTEEPTCLEEGQTVYKCSVCDGILEEPIRKLNHDYTVYKQDYKDGADYKDTLTHKLTCSVGGESIHQEECSMRLIESGDATNIYECSVCGGKATYTKAKYNVAFVDENGDTISSKTYYEGQTVNAPALPKDKIDEAGHHSYKWDVEPSSIPTADITYTIIETVVKHKYTNYEYNNDACKEDVYGTETAKCDIAECTYTDTKSSEQNHAPTKYDINGRITVAADIKGTPSKKAANGLVLTIDGTETKAITNAKGEYQFVQIEAGTYTITISGDTTIDRQFTIIVNADTVDFDHIDVDDIGIITYDYNQDGLINTVDATLMSKDIVQEDVKLFKAVFNKKVKYEAINIG